jgi:hypothetical protein
MSFPQQPGHPNHSSTGATKYIPSIYSALLIKKFYPKTIWGRISNTNYEGEIKAHGDTVHIRTRPKIETFRYKKGMILPVQNPSSPYIDLKITEGDGFSFAIEKVDEFQSDINMMNEWGDDATEQMKQVIDNNVLISIAAQGAVAGGQAKTTIVGYDANYGADLSGYTAAAGALVNGGTTSAATSASTGDKITALLLKFGRYLDENNAPEEGRFAVLPTWCGSILKNMTNNAFGLAYATGQNSSNLIAGTIPKIDRFEVLFSNNIPRSTEAVTDGSAVMFGCAYATTFATQITESRMIDNPFSWGKLMQGLQVYGFNIIKNPLIGVDFWKNA